MIRVLSKNSLAWASAQFYLIKSGINLHCPLETLGLYANFTKAALRRQNRLGSAIDYLIYLT